MKKVNMKEMKVTKVTRVNLEFQELLEERNGNEIHYCTKKLSLRPRGVFAATCNAIGKFA